MELRDLEKLIIRMQQEYTVRLEELRNSIELIEPDHTLMTPLGKMVELNAGIAALGNLWSHVIKDIPPEDLIKV